MAYEGRVAGYAGVLRKAAVYGDLVMFRHTAFALPFAFVGAVLSVMSIPPPTQLFWITLAVLGARNGANALNRLVDKDIDAANPRTAGRHLPQRLVQEREVALLVVACFALFALSAYMLRLICFVLLPVPLAIFIVYSYTKRFTWLCHLVLGAGCGGAPVGAWLAITGRIEIPSLILGAAVALWVAGFDVIYAIQDIEFDRSHGIYSIPARFGASGALIISGLFHLAMIALLFSEYLFIDVGVVYGVGIACVALLLLYEHSIVAPDRLGKVTIASYNVNEVVGFILLVFAVADVVLPK